MNKINKEPAAFAAGSSYLKWPCMSPEQKQSKDKIDAAVDENLYGFIAELCKRHLGKYPEDAYVWYQYADALTELCRFEEVDNAVNNALAYSSPNFHDLVFAIKGRSLFERGDYLEAEKYFLKSVELNTEAMEVHNYLGVCAFSRGNLKLAEERLQRALECDDDPDEIIQDEVLFNLGGVLLAQERYDEATKCYERALALGFKSAKLRLTDIQNIQTLLKEEK